MPNSFLDRLRQKITGGNARAARADAEKIYATIVSAARRPEFFAALDVPDTPEGRFEILTIHVYLVLRRLKAAGEAERERAQALLDIVFQNLDDALREMGVGDLSVGKKMRRMAEAFYGRIAAYGPALDACDPGDAASTDDAGHDTDGEDALKTALARNVYGKEEAHSAAVALGRYMNMANDALGHVDPDALANYTFPPVIAVAETQP